MCEFCFQIIGWIGIDETRLALSINNSGVQVDKSSITLSSLFSYGFENFP